MKLRLFPLFVCLLVVTPATLHAQAPSSPPAQTLVQGAAETVVIKPSSDQVSFKTGADGISVTIQPGKEGYPGITLTPSSGKVFDLSAHGHVEAKVTNTGTKPLGINLRLDNDGDWKTNPYNAESATIKPGESGVVSLIFGYAHGKKKGFPLKPEAVTRILFFSGKSDGEQSFRIESVIGSGAPGETPPVDPATIRVKPEGEVVFGPASKVDAEKQFVLKSGTTAVPAPGQGIRLSFPGGKETGSVSFRPAEGRWDLSQSLQVVVKLKNEGTEPVKPELRLESNGGPSDTIFVGEIPAGASKETAIPFSAKEIWVGASDAGQPGAKGVGGKPGTKLTSDAISAVVVSVANIDSPKSLVIESIKANLPPAPRLPEWLGKRPPVEGEWVKTFDEDFNGTAPDATKWNVYASNYWDKASAFSKDNLIVENGFAKLRYEKKSTHHNDDPTKKKFDYTTGFLDTYGKWVQRYGYYETRTKLPTSPGLWPAFWLMPDRGEAAGEQWKRQDTGNGGMEFDVVEHLTRWGPYRYNIAMHWDGYGKEHKAIGTSNVYIQPDKDGFVTSGLLWLPGSAVYYFNGKEVARWETTRMSAIPSHLMYTLPQGGWDNNEVDDKKLPADFVIDYVRVWQRKDLASPADGPKIPSSQK